MASAGWPKSRSEETKDWARPDLATWSGDSSTLAAELAAALRGEIGFDAGSRALYAADASNYRQPPIGVVFPRDAADVARAVEICRRHRAPLLSRGGGTSLAGQCCNVAVVLDMSRHFNRVLEIDPARRLARVEPGVVLDTLRDAAERHHLTFGPDPATHNHCTLGGMIGNNSCGVHSVLAGRTADNVQDLEILTYDGLRMRVGPTSEDDLASIVRAGGRRGEIYRSLADLRDRYAPLIRARYPEIPRRVSGYNLNQLLPENGFHVARALVGTEGTCVTVLEAGLRLVPSPPEHVLLVIGYRDIYEAADHVPEIMKEKPIGLEGVDRKLIDHERVKRLNVDALNLLPEGEGWLLVEFGAETRAEALLRAERTQHRLRREKEIRDMRIFADRAHQEEIWDVREAGLGSTAWVPGQRDTWPGWEDSAVPPEKLGAYLRDLRRLMRRYEYEGSFYGHFGEGCLHTRMSFDVRTADGIRHYRAFVDEAADLVVHHGGSFSGEHGDGQARAELLPKLYGAELCEAFREFKAVWDPDGRMNPGNVSDPHPITSNLRLGAGYRPWEPATHFRYPDDHYEFSRAALRCVGVGKCRREGGGTMCPSYMVTREERHSTRGRAHLLFEMLQGNPITRGWRSDEVREALDLCLACKGCKNDCPVNVDMATYKAEFLSHHYKRRLRPVAAYSMGLIYWWARLASHLPRAANFITHAPLLGRGLKVLGGIAPHRDMPRFARETFRHWFEHRPEVSRGGLRVLLWPDTFTNFLQPRIPRAAVEVLEAAGFEVAIPKRVLCCGRPLYDYGMLDLAKHLLRQILVALAAEIERGVPIVGLEPSCVATFRDELVNLFPHDERARRLSGQVLTLNELFERHASAWQPPELHRKALVHGHCHHKSILGFEGERRLLSRLGLDVELPATGCCGMAGSFGFEKEKYGVSIACGERVLLPAVRRCTADTLIVADGFSCREQVAQTTGREALHLAEVMRLALREDDGDAAGEEEAGSSSSR
jgi:FAD/FMN-containing dehydrogenase/Fe-S oxidoreductase